MGGNTLLCSIKPKINLKGVRIKYEKKNIFKIFFHYLLQSMKNNECKLFNKTFNLDFLFKRKSKEKLNYDFFKIYTPLLDSRSLL